VGTGTLQDWITHDGSSADISVDPQVATNIGSFSVSTTMTIQYTNGGSGSETIDYEAVQWTTGCTIVDIPNPTNPDDSSYTLTYTLYEPTLTIDIRDILWTQSPPCEFAATSTTSWTNPEPNVIYVSPFSDFILSVSTMDKTKLGAHTVTLVNSLEYLGVSW
jgi:hypothetical protein